MTNDVLEHLKAIKNQINDFKKTIDECKDICMKQSDTIIELREILSIQSEKIKDLEIEVQILKDGGNI